jgi:polysaccharide pyruvyl transferase WcaK-like protein
MESIYKNLDKDIKDKVVIIDEYLYVEDYLSLIGNMDIMVAMRLHGLIFSVLMGVYPVGISYDPKIQSFLHMMDREDAMEVENLNATLLYKELKDVFINKEEHTIKLKEYQNKFIELADTHNHKVYDLLSQ